MPIPDYQALMLPLLRHLDDGCERSNRETLDALAEEFGLSAQEREELLPSGRQQVFTNRVAWAKVHLKAARLIESPRRGFYRITARGRELLSRNPNRLDLRSLKSFPDYRQWRSPKGDREGEDAARSVGFLGRKAGLTPEELVEYGVQKLREGLAAELIRRIKEASPSFFERLVVDLLIAMGYGGSRRDAGRTLGRSGDGGVDGLIKEDRLGLDVIYIQAKRWDGTVGRPEVQKFAGALQGRRAKRGVFITTSCFSKDARDYAASIESRIILINGDQLASLMIDHGVGVNRAATYEILRIDTDYFDES